MSVCSELPVGTDAARYVQRHGKVDGVFHGVAHQFGDLVAFSRRDFHYQFIVNLQNDTALDVSLGALSAARSAASRATRLVECRAGK